MPNGIQNSNILGGMGAAPTADRFSQNPFADLIRQQPAQVQQPAQQPLAPVAGGQPGGQAEPQAPPEEQRIEDNSKPLLAAIHNLHSYVVQTADLRDIKMVRNLISLLTQLVARDQQRCVEEMGQMEGGQPEPQVGPQLGPPNGLQNGNGQIV